jgi:subtilisin family serine protease
VLVAASALAAPLTLDPDHPPERVGTADGLPVYRYAPRVELVTLPAVVVQQAEELPGARHLGGPFWLVAAEDPVAEALRHPRAFPDVVIRRSPRFDDPSYGGQWHLEQLGMEALWEVSLGDPGAIVAVIDSGIDIAHVDLADGVVDPYDALDDDEDPSPPVGEYCEDDEATVTCDEHGTAVAGIVGARADNGAGVVGMCPACSLVPIRLLGDKNGSLSDDVAAFEHAAGAGAAVINNSWGFTEYIAVPQTLADAIADVSANGRGGLGSLVVFAAGNEDHEIEDDEMQALEDVLCVGATDLYGNPTNYTNYGATLDVAAPAATVTDAPYDQVTTEFGGTSAAAPVVSGLAGWIIAQRPEMTADELKDFLIATAEQSPLVKPDENGHSDTYGYGIIHPANVLAALYPDTGGGGESGGADTGSPADSGSAPAQAPEDEGPAGCGCDNAALGAGPGLLAFLLARRRRC